MQAVTCSQHTCCLHAVNPCYIAQSCHAGKGRHVGWGNQCPERRLWRAVLHELTAGAVPAGALSIEDSNNRSVRVGVPNLRQLQRYDALTVPLAFRREILASQQTALGCNTRVFKL